MAHDRLLRAAHDRHAPSRPRRHEAAARAPNPLSRAAHAVDAITAERGFHVGDLSRAYAVIAFAEGRPALATGSHNAWIVVDAVNAGRGSAEALTACPAALAVTVALNPAGERLLRAARTSASAPVALAA